MMKKCFLLLFAFFVVINAKSNITETRFRFRAKIIDARTEKALSDFPVKVKEYNRSVFTNQNGEILLNMPQGEYTFILDDYPYISKEIKVVLSADQILY